MKNLGKFSNLFLHVAVALLTYQLLRAFFWLGNLSHFHHESFPEVAMAYLTGIRFDLWAVSWSFLPFLLWRLMPTGWVSGDISRRLQWLYLSLVQFWCIGLNVIDVELYKFTGRRLTPAWLKIQQDVEGQTWSLVRYYWWIALLGLVVWWLSLKIHKRLIEQNSQATGSRVSRFFKTTATIIATFLAMRGGWQLKPLSLAHAFNGGSAEIGVLRLNSTFTFFRSRGGVESVSLRFMKGKETERNQWLDSLQKLKSVHFGDFRGRNVVILIIESLGAEYMGALNGGRGYTPFLDKLSEQGLLFSNFFANGRRSIEAVPSIVCGLPSLMGEALLLSPFQDVNIRCLPHALAKAGYDTAFFHGAHNGSMHFDSFAARAGFKAYFGYNEYPNAKEDDDKSWGIFDEPFLQFAIEKMNQMKSPFMTTIFTLSSHHPYPIPEKYKGQFLEGELEIHPSIRYVDLALEKFFESAKKQYWFNNTFFLITGDHTQKSISSRYQTNTGVYRVPMLLFAPNSKLGEEIKTHEPGQHIDMAPTVTDLLGIEDPKERLRIGQTLLSNESPGIAFNANDSGYWLIREQRQVEYNHANRTFSHKRVSESGDIDTKVTSAELDDAARRGEMSLKSIVDYFNQGIVENKLSHE